MNDEISDFEPVHRALPWSEESQREVERAGQASAQALLALRDSIAAMTPLIPVAMGASRNALLAGLERLPAVQVDTPPAEDAD